MYMEETFISCICMYIHVCTWYIQCSLMYILVSTRFHSSTGLLVQLKLVHKLPHVADPSDEIVEVLIQCMDWNIASRQSGIPDSEMPDLQQKAVIFLTSCRKTSLIRLGKRPSGILKRPIAFCTRSVNCAVGKLG